MTKKVSISLPDHVHNLAIRKVEVLQAGNFSSYINSLICREFSSEELEREFDKIAKPISSGQKKAASYESQCPVCNEIIHPGDEIYLATKKSGKTVWVHGPCCKQP